MYSEVFKPSKVISYGILIIYAIFTLLPFFFVVITSVKTMSEIYTTPVTYIPRQPTLESYKDILTVTPYLSYVMNSTFISFGVLLICLLFGTLSAYGLARFSFPFRRWYLYAIIGVRLFPPISFIVPFYLIISRLGLHNTKLGLIIGNLFLQLPFYVWITWNYFNSIPTELEEAALVDGCTKIQALRKIILPLAAPGIAAASIVTFLFTWNEYLFGLILTSTPQARPVAVGIATFLGDVFVNWNQVAGGAIIAIIPSLIFVLFLQKYLIEGLTAGALKG